MSRGVENRGSLISVPLPNGPQENILKEHFKYQAQEMPIPNAFVTRIETSYFR